LLLSVTFGLTVFFWGGREFWKSPSGVFNALEAPSLISSRGYGFLSVCFILSPNDISEHHFATDVMDTVCNLLYNFDVYWTVRHLDN